jgi:hypothetical protein
LVSLYCLTKVRILQVFPLSRDLMSSGKFYFCLILDLFNTPSSQVITQN